MKTKTLRKVLMGLSAVALSSTMVLTGILPNFSRKAHVQANPEYERIRDVTNSIGGAANLDLRDYLNTSVVQSLSGNISPDREISVMLALDTETILDGYDALGETSMSVGDFAASRQGKAIASKIGAESRSLQSVLTREGLNYELGVTYNTLIGGFEVIIRAGDFDKLQKAVGASANVIVSEEYEPAISTPTENDVAVLDTGIFDSTAFEEQGYNGSGTLLAVVDTGLDYTHSAFDVSRFRGEERLNLNRLSELMRANTFTAAKRTEGLTASDVYINAKVPFAYDYADSDPDVFPINSEHGTHVAGIMAGLDDPDTIGKTNPNGEPGEPLGIRGVAPQAQLAIIKVFSEKTGGAKQSWIIAGLEDCVLLGVDVINMSLGASCGFSREVDDYERIAVYDSIKEHGINLVAAASNDGSAYKGSEKNGSLPLTSNPDSATTGNPATYDAALSVASIAGDKTPYLKYGDQIIYFNESMDHASQEKHFVAEVLAKYNREHSTNVTSLEFEYVLIDGIGSTADYGALTKEELQGKIFLISRGTTNFEEKALLARDYGAAGAIIYNNVSGDILMTVGSVGDFPVCSISRDDGLTLAAAKTGKIVIGSDQIAGPFMSDFSSWGPTPDLGIKPEITAHGGNIWSAVPGQKYEKMSGTSMASPNQAGFTALVRQYVKQRFNLDSNKDAVQIMELVNQLMMSTADIAINTNGIPFAVRKQGAGLANLAECTTTPAVARTYDRYNHEKISDKTKLELGDDPNKTGVYTFDFQIWNFGTTSLTYNADAIVLTEGVSQYPTIRGDNTVTEKGYLLYGTDVEKNVYTGAKITVKNVQDGTFSGNSITVGANATAIVTMEISLTDESKRYLEENFENGMYVEGFVTLDATSGTDVDLNIPYLTFYGDWTQAPLFDLDYFETNEDELNASIPTDQKTLPDSIATVPIGALYSDYITYLGSFVYTRDPSSTMIIAADRDKIALTNREGEYGGVNGIYAVWCGLLRGAKRMEMEIVEEATGTVIKRIEDFNLPKSLGNGAAFSQTPFEVDFKVKDYDLKNNSKYVVRLTAFLDYGEDGGLNTNKRNVFEFPFYTDFEAPIATGVEYEYEYDSDKKINRLYANISVYDNHYSMGYFASSLKRNESYTAGSDEFLYTTDAFSSYVEPVLGERNSISNIRIELTDHIDKIKQSYNGRSFIVQVMDYALNTGIYEFNIPDEIQLIDFNEMHPENEGDFKGVRISPNETYRLNPVIFPSQDEAWAETLNYTSSNEDIVKVVNGQLVGVATGDATITATSNRNPEVHATLTVKVLGPTDEGYVSYDKPIVESFKLSGYYVEKVFYRMSSADRDLGVDYAKTDSGENKFVSFDGRSSYALSMFPSESIRVVPEIKGFFKQENYHVEYSTTNKDVVDVTTEGVITAKNVTVDENGVEHGNNTERSATISIKLFYLDEDGNWNSTIYSTSISIKVKKPYITNGNYLTSYFGLGGSVEIPADLRIETINSFAFSNYDLVPKDLSAGDVIDKEDPYNMKQWYLGEDTITEVILSDEVKVIESYAFAGLTKLKRVVLPSSIEKIQTGAFMGCTSLETVEYKDGATKNLQFVNENAFKDCGKLASFPFDSVVAIGVGAFENTNLINVNLPQSTGSIGARAFANNANLKTLSFGASSIKVGENAFTGCRNLQEVYLNASVVPNGVLENCVQLKTVKLGPDVQVIGQYAFRNTEIETFEVDPENKVFSKGENGKYLTERAELDGVEVTKLSVIAPTVKDFSPANADDIKIIGAGALSTAGVNLTTVKLPAVTVVEDYGLANCTELTTLQLGDLTSVGMYAFINTNKLRTLPTFAAGASIGSYAFSGSALQSVSLPERVSVGSYAFANNTSLNNVEVKDGVEIGERAFYGDYRLATVKLGNKVSVGSYAFAGIPADDFIHLPEIYPIMQQVLGEQAELGMYVSTDRQYNYAGNGIYSNIIPMISGISSLTIGTDAVIGDNAFRGAGSLRYELASNAIFGGTLASVQLGTGASIGNSAFYGCMNLNSINLSGAKYIGDYAFAGSETEHLVFVNGILEFGSEWPTAAKIPSVDLSAAEYVGEGAFQDNTALATLNLGNLTAVGSYAFDGCTSLSKLTAKALTSVGDYAFRSTKIDTISFANEATIGNGAFQNDTFLRKESGLENAVSIGDYAFAGTALTKVSLSARKVGSFAFMDSKVTSVSFGDILEEIGENPFSGCAIGEFTRTEGENTINTFDIGVGGVKVIEGVLYRSCANGLEIISYPQKKEAKQFVIADGTVRVGARAFYGSELVSVTIPREVVSIGDRAFYACDSLSTVVFRSFEAPRLEEQFDSAMEEELDWTTGVQKYLVNSFGIVILGDEDDEIRTGLGYIDWRMWGYDSSTVFYGANFVRMITDVEMKQHPLVMVRPVNGTGYDSFTYQQYFVAVIDGAAAPTAQAIEVERMIDALPALNTLQASDYDRVYEIVNLYNTLSNTDKAYLDQNGKYTILVGAQRIVDGMVNPGTTPGGTVDPVNPGKADLTWLWIVLGVVGGLIVIAAIVVVVLVVGKKKGAKNGEAESEEKKPQPEADAEAESAEEKPQPKAETNSDEEKSE